MRLTSEQANAIKKQALKIFGHSTEIWLFGSRVKEDARGGDIDIYIEGDETDNAFNNKIELKLQLLNIFGEQKIDIVYHNRNLPLQPIHIIAKQEGIKL